MSTILYWIAAFVGIVALSAIALAVVVLRMVDRFFTRE